MKLTDVKRFVLEEFPQDQRAWISLLTDPLNNFAEEVSKALLKRLTIADNMAGLKTSLNIAVGQTYPMRVSYNLPDRPSDVHVGYIAEDSGNPGTIPVWSMQWVFIADATNGNSVNVTFSGLDSTKKYIATIITQV